MKPPRPLCALRYCVLLVLLLGVSPASAEDGKYFRDSDHIFLLPGFLFSIGFCCHEKTVYGLGGELSVSRFSQSGGGSYGGFFQIQRYLPDDYRFTRVAVGLQAGYTLGGAEVGVARQSASASTKAATGLQLTPYGSIGLIWTGFRFTFPGAPGLEGERSGASIEWVIAGKLPLPIEGSVDLPVGPSR